MKLPRPKCRGFFMPKISLKCRPHILGNLSVCSDNAALLRSLTDESVGSMVNRTNVRSLTDESVTEQLFDPKLTPYNVGNV
jgi:hypothetical protein